MKTKAVNISFLKKTEYREIILPFIYDDNPEDLHAGLISIEAYGNISGENKYCYVSYLVNLKFINEIAALLKNSSDKTVKVILKVKNGRAKDFKIDLDSLAEAYNDERFKSFELFCWGLNNKSFKDFNSI
ncbi:MAG: hypothetical protein ACI4IJ_02100 [Acutalibacteraceae bacterium]